MVIKPYLQRMRGGGAAGRPPPLRAVIRPFVGAFLAIATVAYLASATAVPLVLGSFGASCVLLFGFPNNPFSQPRNVSGGHPSRRRRGLSISARSDAGLFLAAAAVIKNAFTPQRKNS